MQPSFGHIHQNRKSVIDLVHNIVIQDGMPTNLNISRITGVTLYDTAWTAGVEYALQSQEDIEDKADTDFDHKSEANKENLDADYNLVDHNEVENINEDEVNPKRRRQQRCRKRE